MAADVNRVTLIGRLTKDPEAIGEVGTRLRVAVNSRRKKGDEWVEEGNFFNVAVFGKLGEVVAEHMVKGRQVAVDGRLQHSEWEDDSGNKRESVGIVADSVQFLGGGKKEQAEEPDPF